MSRLRWVWWAAVAGIGIHFGRGVLDIAMSDMAPVEPVVPPHAWAMYSAPVRYLDTVEDYDITISGGPLRTPAALGSVAVARELASGTFGTVLPPEGVMCVELRGSRTSAARIALARVFDQPLQGLVMLKFTPEQLTITADAYTWRSWEVSRYLQFSQPVKRRLTEVSVPFEPGSCS